MKTIKIQNIFVKLDELYKNIDWNKVKVISLSTFLWGIFAHGFMIFNKFSWGDDVTNMYYFGTTYELGRWMLEGLRRIFVFIFETNCSQPFINGMGSLLCIGIAAYILTNVFQLKEVGSWIALTGTMVTLPTMTLMFSFMFTSFPYMIGMLMGVTGVCMVVSHKIKIGYFAIGSVLICLSIGIYQAWFPMALSLFVLCFLKEVFNDKYPTWKAYFSRGLYYLGVCVVALLLYLCVNEYFILTKDIVMNDHSGLNTYGMVGIKEYFGRVLYAYRMFFRPSRGFYPSFISKVYKLLLLIVTILTILQMAGRFRESLGKGLQTILPLVALPLSVCFIYVLAGDGNALVLYPYIIVYVYFLWLMESKIPNKNIYSIWGKRAGIVLVLLMSVWLCRYSNVTYMKANMLQSRAISYYTTLITRIQSIDGYSEELPIAYVNANQNMSLKTVTITSDLENAGLLPDTFLNDYSWEAFMQEWCGFLPQKANGEILEKLKELEEVRSMPSYPNAGSIKIIDGVLVVKLSDS